MSTEPDADEIDWDEWMALSDGERERETVAAERQWNETWARMSPAQRFGWRRRMAVECCRRYRKLMAGGMLPESFCREWLRAAQVRLVKLRIERATGLRPGSA